MVTIARRLAVAAGVLAILAGCNLGVGIFPDRLMSYEGYDDLAGDIAPEWISDFEFRLVRDPRPDTGHPEYLVLVSDNDAFDGVHLLVYDAGLRVLGTWTLEELDAMAASEFMGRGSMVDANGRIVVGNRAFTVAGGVLTYDDSVEPQPGYLGQAIVQAGVSDPNIAEIRTNNDLLEFQRHPADWTTGTPQSYDIGPDPWYKIAGLWLREDAEQLLVIVDNDIINAHIIQLDSMLFATGGLLPDLITNYPHCVITDSNNIAWDTLGFVEFDKEGTTVEAFAVYHWGLNRYVLIDRFTGTQIAVSPDEVPDDQRPFDGSKRHVYGRSSGWYILDRKAMTLERRAWWWQ